MSLVFLVIRPPRRSTLFPSTTLLPICRFHHDPPRFIFAKRQPGIQGDGDRKSTRLNSRHLGISYAVFCLKNTTVFLPAHAPLTMAAASALMGILAVPASGTSGGPR